MDQQIATIFLAEIERRLFAECFPRLTKCISMLSEEQIWSRPNQISNSLGNIVLHLKGNTRQWMGTTFGGRSDDRRRAAEFSESGPLPKAHLLRMVSELQTDLEGIFKEIKQEDLLKEYDVQVYRETGLAILVHVTEHFSYHVGQATYLVKMLTGRPTGYYEGQDLG